MNLKKVKAFEWYFDAGVSRWGAAYDAPFLPPVGHNSKSRSKRIARRQGRGDAGVHGTYVVEETITKPTQIAL